ncbi:MAG: hypothetical protein SW833_16335 [Cyanobacteriota bacterium]|nr:hypothetical protein [Cyanobacteriota bacterium]
MKKFHIALSVNNLAASIEDYSKRLGCQPCVAIANEYALWRTESVNFSIRQTGEASGTLRHLGWEDSQAVSFSKEVDINGIEWEEFNARTQADEIEKIWPHVCYSPTEERAAF